MAKTYLKINWNNNNTNEALVPTKETLENIISELPQSDDSKMDKQNPTGTGSFSLNRRDGTTIGNYSFAEGDGTTASGDYSHAEGSYTTASGNYSHAEGNITTASGDYSHAEGFNTTASGHYSHAEGIDTTASGDHSHAEGIGTIASYDSDQHVQGKFNIEDSSRTYADIIGNGTKDTARSNAATVDWSGNAWYAGDVYVGSTSGTNRDEGSEKLATEMYVHLVKDIFPSSTMGSAKRFRITVDDNGTISAIEIT